MRDNDGRFPKLLDFGISKVAETAAPARPSDAAPVPPGAKRPRLKQLTKVGVTLGTPCYMAPEQLRGSRDLDARADLYSVGVILYQWLTGHVPYAHESLAELALQVIARSAPTLADLRPELGQQPFASGAACAGARAGCSLSERAGDARCAGGGRECGSGLGILREGQLHHPRSPGQDAGRAGSHVELLEGARRDTAAPDPPLSCATSRAPGCGPWRRALPCSCSRSRWLREARPGLASAEQSGSTLVIGAPIQSSAPVPATAPLNVAASDEAKAAPVEPEPSKRSEMRKRTRRTKRTPAPREP